MNKLKLITDNTDLLFYNRRSMLNYNSTSFKIVIETIKSRENTPHDSDSKVGNMKINLIYFLNKF
jgi:hypothetical protein